MGGEEGARRTGHEAWARSPRSPPPVEAASAPVNPIDPICLECLPARRLAGAVLLAAVCGGMQRVPVLFAGLAGSWLLRPALHAAVCLLWPVRAWGWGVGTRGGGGWSRSWGERGGGGEGGNQRACGLDPMLRLGTLPTAPPPSEPYRRPAGPLPGRRAAVPAGVRRVCARPAALRHARPAGGRPAGRRLAGRRRGGRRG